MTSIFSPSQARIPIGLVVIAGKSYEATINIEWARYFEEMTKALNAATALGAGVRNGIDGPAVGMMSDGGGIEVEFIPGPQGIAGARGEAGPAINFLINEDASPEFIPGPTGPQGRQGDAGPALFLMYEAESPTETILPPSTVSTEAFIIPTLINSWANYGGAFSLAGYFKDQDGVVHLRGLVANGTGLSMFTLPVGYRPALTSVFTVVANNAFGRVDVSASGDINLTAGSNLFVSLEGITFRAS